MEALANLTDGQMQQGIETLLKSGAEHIPSLPNFLVSCCTAREWSYQAPAIEASQEDRWEVAANGHLMAHVWKCAGKKIYFDLAQTLILVAFKHSWADDCRADSKAEGLDVGEQKLRWKEAMESAHKAAGLPLP